MSLRLWQTKALECESARRTAGEEETNMQVCTGAGKSKVIALITNSITTSHVVIVFPSLLLLSQYHKAYRSDYERPLCYLATEGTLPGVQKLNPDAFELPATHTVILTTYVSAPRLLGALEASGQTTVTVHDEAHHTTGPIYARAYSDAVDAGIITYTLNMSATLPEEMPRHFSYSLLAGIRDGVVRDFNLELVMCTEKDRSLAPAKLLTQCIELLRPRYEKVRCLIYTAEANTDGATASSVKTLLRDIGDTCRDMGWWLEGLNEETAGRRETILDEFEAFKGDVAILVSCKTLSEGIDLKGVNCGLFWDPTTSSITIIQRIGRSVRLLKTKSGEFAKEQPPSAIIVPVFLNNEEYAACGGDRTTINALLQRQIAEGERGNFAPVVNVCAALKSELADEDEELFNQLLNPCSTKTRISKDLVECVAKKLKVTKEVTLETIATWMTENAEADDETVEAVRRGEWDDEEGGMIATALAATHNLTLVVKDGENSSVFGKGSTSLLVEKEGEGEFKVKSGKAAEASSKAANKHMAHRLRINLSEDCKVLLGLETPAGVEAAEGMVLARLTTEVQADLNWDARRLEWVAMRQKLGRGPSSSSKNLDERHAGQWRQQQRVMYWKKEKRMTPDRIAILSDPHKTPGWKWEEEDTWELNRIHWLAVYEKLGRSPSNSSKDLDEKRASAWQSNQRQNFKKKDTCMTPDRIAILSNPYQTPGWKWKEEDTWEANRLHWVAIYKKLGKTPSDNSKDPDEKLAGKWQSHQRLNLKNRASWMTPGRIAILSDPHQTPGWKWKEEDTWDANRLHWLAVYEKLGQSPPNSSKDPDEKCAAKWQCTQRQGYKKGASWMTEDRIAILSDPEKTPGWKWKEEDAWEVRRQEWIIIYEKLDKTPSQGSKDPDEKRAASWQSDCRLGAKKKEPWMTPERIAVLDTTPGWTWSAKEAPVTPYVPPATPTIAAAPAPSLSVLKKTRARKAASAPVPVSTEAGAGAGAARQRSQLEVFHSRFKSMNAGTYAAHMASHPEEFEAYHRVAAKYDERDPEDRKPINKIAAELAKNNRPSYSAIDLGCGLNQLRSHPSVSKMHWTSVDVHAVDDSVTVADMGALPYEDESHDVAVCSRSLWAKNIDAVLLEIFRILKTGGRLIVSESFQRWKAATGDGAGIKNTLIDALKRAGFVIEKADGADAADETDDVFQLIVARKP